MSGIIYFTPEYISNTFLALLSATLNPSLYFFTLYFVIVCHAEMNAIMNKNSADVKNCTIYVALFPCNECTKLIIQAGIKEVVYYSDKYHDRPEMMAARKMLDMAKINYR